MNSIASYWTDKNCLFVFYDIFIFRILRDRIDKGMNSYYIRWYEFVLNIWIDRRWIMRKSTFEKLHRINYLGAEMDALYHQACHRLGISDSAMRALYTVYDNGGTCLLSDIYKQSGISKQTVNSAMRKLENDGVLYLEQEDGRGKRVRLTEKGKRYVEKTAARLYAAECEVFSDWPEQEIDTYIYFMEKFNDMFRRQIAHMEWME